ncbi:WW domain-binding protein 11-like [Serinus canaria]|uniref:WW domain-binding protein 11-like n=1 Tax=Serinus canaria TaxID=9135 RepID=UPI0021CD0DC0|nr:WW domain-binding protein 11-like [Serinus canaria]
MTPTQLADRIAPFPEGRRGRNKRTRETEIFPVCNKGWYGPTWASLSGTRGVEKFRGPHSTRPPLALFPSPGPQLPRTPGLRLARPRLPLRSAPRPAAPPEMRPGPPPRAAPPPPALLRPGGGKRPPLPPPPRPPSPPPSLTRPSRCLGPCWAAAEPLCDLRPAPGTSAPRRSSPEVSV